MSRLIDFGDYLTPEQLQEQKDSLPSTYETIVVGEGGRGLTVSLPCAEIGVSIIVRNPIWHSYDDARVYSRGIDRINGVAPHIPFRLRRGFSVQFECRSEHEWQSSTIGLLDQE